jgi:hypothetical protein
MLKRFATAVFFGLVAVGTWASAARGIEIAAYTFLPSATNKTSSDTELNSVANDIAFYGGTNWTDINAIQVPSNANAGTAANSIINNDYIGFKVTADAGYVLNLDSLSWAAWFNPPNTHTLNMFLRSDVDGFSSDLATGSTTSNTAQPFNADLSGPAFQNLPEIELRLYLYDTTDASTLYNVNGARIVQRAAGPMVGRKV